MTDKSTTLEQIKVMQAYAEGKPIEMTMDGAYWSYSLNPTWDWFNFYYRVKELTKPSIDWSHVSDEYNYLAQDKDGTLWLYSHKPILDYESWKFRQYTGEGILEAKPFASAKSGNCDWKNSLVERP